jgi:predicted lipoprotein with Yx(FWY)xxD motif
MSLFPSWRAGAAALLLAAPLALSACGTTETSVPASLAVPVGNGSPIGGTSVSSLARDSISTADTFVGTVMTSGGFTLYRFTKDRIAPPASTCTGPCAASWPPVTVAGQPPLNGVDPKLIGTVVRPDGSKQLTVAGWPVYRYAKDMVPGIVNGEGVGGTWLAIGPDGKPIARPAASAKPTAAPAVPAAPARGPAAAATKAPAAPATKAKVAPKAVPAPSKAPAPKVVTPRAPVVAPTTVIRDAPGTSSTD